MARSLSKDHRKILEKKTAEARQLAESACTAALENLAVHEKEYRSHMTVEQRELRNRLRARGKALGQPRDPSTGTQKIDHLIEVAAYEHWHRLLFTRFLTENNLLITDEGNGSVPVTMKECEELAPTLGARDGLDLACRFAGRTLPGVFRRDDPVLELLLALNDQVELRKLLAALPSECFKADDALGWTYQFWQAQRKDEINDSGRKIGADELAPVTQLFTEDYMVEFLLHNTLGAWWAGKRGPITAATEEDARVRVALGATNGVQAITWTYLRFVQDEKTKTWSPAAGTFDGWPKTAREIKLLDPCMGSGHFLVFALPLLARLRMEEEGLSSRAAVVAVLKDNIYGLELDERCTQIAAFNLALTAWKLAGYQQLPALHLACSGLAPSATEAEWVALAGDNDRLRRGMARLHKLFKDAPVLGSLINPRAQAGDLIEADYRELAPLLDAALAAEKTKDDEEQAELAVVAQGITKAAELLAGQFTLVITNVPFLGGYKQHELLATLITEKSPLAGGNLANAFLIRLLDFLPKRQVLAVVTPQDWMLLGRYIKMRRSVLEKITARALAFLGTHAFETIRGEVVTAALSVWENRQSQSSDLPVLGIDAQPFKTIIEKVQTLTKRQVTVRHQSEWASNPNVRITVETIGGTVFLQSVARPWQGIKTSDDDRFVQCFWEGNLQGPRWRPVLRSLSDDEWSGRQHKLLWEGGCGSLRKLNAAQERDRKRDLQGIKAHGKTGIAVNTAGRIIAGQYSGEAFTSEIVVLTLEAQYLLPVLEFCRSEEFAGAIEKLDKRVSVTTSTFAQVPFDLGYWQTIASDKYSNGAPKPNSSDPTQWIFNGHPKGSGQPLHVAVCRLLGYGWPRQTGCSFTDCPALGPDGLEKFSDEDGIVCLPPLNREQPGAARLRQFLTAALGSFDERALIAKAGPKGSKSKTLEDWLRDEFFEQHTALFHDRPFMWHLWDGRRDGFHVLVNYHKLDHANLQKLAYSYLGNWIQQQTEEAKADKPGAAERLGSARNLQAKFAAILEGEAPLDIFVRWKSIKEQACGWHPDLNDGIRQNIRPFLLAGDVGKRGAGLFRATPLSLRDKDRGAEPDLSKDEYPWFWRADEPETDPVGGNKFEGTRWNSVHLTLERKRRAE